MITKGPKGWLRAFGNRPWSASAYASLTANSTERADTKVGASDPVVERGIAIAQQIIGTLGITGLSGSRVHIDSPVWHLDIMGWFKGNFEHVLTNNGGTRRIRAIPWEVFRKLR